jgi:hypothetical protein
LFLCYVTVWAYVIREVKRGSGRKTGNKDDIEADYGFLTGVPDVSERKNKLKFLYKFSLCIPNHVIS